MSSILPGVAPQPGPGLLARPGTSSSLLVGRLASQGLRRCRDDFPPEAAALPPGPGIGRSSGEGGVGRGKVRRCWRADHPNLAQFGVLKEYLKAMLTLT